MLYISALFFSDNFANIYSKNLFIHLMFLWCIIDKDKDYLTAMESIGSDMVMVSSNLSYKNYEDDEDRHSNNSDDSSVAVVYGKNDPPFFVDNKLQSLSTACVGDGSPLEQRDDIIEVCCY